LIATVVRIIRANLAPAWARQDHTTSPSAKTRRSSFGAFRVHRIPLHVRDDAYAPPEGNGTTEMYF
jgi:hypothetical protein